MGNTRGYVLIFLVFNLLFISVRSLSETSDAKAPETPFVARQLGPRLNSLLTCDTLRVRRDFRDFTEIEKLQFRNAIDSAIAAGDWQLMVNFHNIFTLESHEGCYFLPWHRLFTFLMESILRQYEPQVTIPYWDWAREAADPAMSDIWSSLWLGSAPLLNNSLSVLGVVRNFTSGVSGSLNSFPDWTMIQERSLYHPFWPIFASQLELMHNLVHLNIGGHMSSLSLAPTDPIFYVHHAFVDYVWYIRQIQFNNVWEFGGLHRGSEVCDNNYYRIFEAYELPAWRGMDYSCIFYQNPQNPVIGRSAADDRNVTHGVPQLRCDDEGYLNMTGLSFEMCSKTAELEKDVLSGTSSSSNISSLLGNSTIPNANFTSMNLNISRLSAE